MPRRPTPLDPADGPRAQFALELRALRDRLGADAPSIDTIAKRFGVSRAALYATLNGRIPSRPVLQAMIDAWGGDREEWFRKRSAVESAIANEQQARRDAITTPERRRAASTAFKEAHDAFFADLMKLRTAAGASTLADVKKRVDQVSTGDHTIGLSLLHELFGNPGKTNVMPGVPSWSVLEPVVLALGGNRDEWFDRVEELRRHGLVRRGARVSQGRYGSRQKRSIEESD